MAVALLGAAPALAAERLDHRGAVGLLLAGGIENRTAFTFDGATPDNGWRQPLLLGGTWAFGPDGNEWLAAVRVGLGGPTPAWSIFGGYRGYFGQDRWKTFLDLDLMVNVTPVVTGGIRVGGGVQYELSPNVGLFFAGGLHLGVGNGLVFGPEVLGGIQLRSYLLEG